MGTHDTYFVLKAGLVNKLTNVQMDSGASCSVIDARTLKTTGDVRSLSPISPTLINASGDEMDISGVKIQNTRH